MTQGKKKGELYSGNGCRLHPDCFTCPCPEFKGCVWPIGGTKIMKDTAIKLWKPYFERELSRVGGKG